MKTPDSADCASSVPLGNVTPIAFASRLLHLQACPGPRVVLRIDSDPASALHLLHTHQVVAVVARSVEAELALDRVDAVLLDVRGNRLVVEAAGTAHTGFENLPRGVRRRCLHFDARIG